MSILNEIEDVIKKYNKEVLAAKKKKMKSLPGWYGLDSPHAGGAHELGEESEGRPVSYVYTQVTHYTDGREPEVDVQTSDRIYDENGSYADFVKDLESWNKQGKIMMHRKSPEGLKVKGYEYYQTDEQRAKNLKAEKGEPEGEDLLKQLVDVGAVVSMGQGRRLLQNAPERKVKEIIAKYKSKKENENG